ncbi:hypothetical protein LJ656_33590 [Paraburkholderia sp. MMS20-SJTR3]|uniref:Uncharacterized protein n=1 Tax=Paraburkholderia sejongensis TaxID=2886946 RepID=A0ABS8K5T8_9BURK|nr:hypothetical protein [Paraburkholderia sp. MMS20-SJTR3]MCC8397490.1 hypothetical protein [Paraburkholderia sp. MMS20-SJTR3]
MFTRGLRGEATSTFYALIKLCAWGPDPRARADKRLYGPIDNPDAPGYWSAFIFLSDDDIDGPTYLAAGMRAYIVSMFGADVEDLEFDRAVGQPPRRSMLSPPRAGFFSSTGLSTETVNNCSVELGVVMLRGYPDSA